MEAIVGAFKPYGRLGSIRTDGVQLGSLAKKTLAPQVIVWKGVAGSTLAAFWRFLLGNILLASHSTDAEESMLPLHHDSCLDDLPHCIGLKP